MPTFKHIEQSTKENGENQIENFRLGFDFDPERIDR